MTKTNEEELFEQIEPVEESILEKIPDSQQTPTYKDVGWTEYMLGFLSKKELRQHNGKEYPTTDGLRRLCTAKFGQIVYSASRLVEPANESNRFTCTVEHTLRVVPYGDGLDFVEIVAVADANERNTDSPYNKFLSPNASTRALGRCLRDLLQLQVCTADELSKEAEKATFEDPEDAQLIEGSQKAAIITLCKRLGIDLYKFINLGPIQHKSIDQVLKGSARKMVSVLNSYQQGKQIPEEIKL